MSNTEWILNDLRKLRERFRDARLEFPGLRSQLAHRPSDGSIWHVQDWLRVDSFAQLREVEPSLGNDVRPAVSYFFLQPWVANLERGQGAGWELLSTAALFGQLATSLVATLHLHDTFKVIAERFWARKDERTWLAWLHKFRGTWAPEELTLELQQIPFDFDAKTVVERYEVNVSHIDDVFEMSCRELDQLIAFLEGPTGNQLARAPAPAQRSPIKVCLSPPQVTISDIVYSVRPDGALFVQALLDAKGDWIAGSSLEMRADRVRASLPESIQLLIESSPGKGYRLKREPLSGTELA